jgi:hypothetical protein
VRNTCIDGAIGAMQGRHPRMAACRSRALPERKAMSSTAWSGTRIIRIAGLEALDGDAMRV